jgi:hypothetical protein
MVEKEPARSTAGKGCHGGMRARFSLENLEKGPKKRRYYRGITQKGYRLFVQAII